MLIGFGQVQDRLRALREVTPTLQAPVSEPVLLEKSVQGYRYRILSRAAAEMYMLAMPQYRVIDEGTYAEQSPPPLPGISFAVIEHEQNLTPPLPGTALDWIVSAYNAGGGVVVIPPGPIGGRARLVGTDQAAVADVISQGDPQAFVIVEPKDGWVETRVVDQSKSRGVVSTPAQEEQAKAGLWAALIFTAVVVGVATWAYRGE